MLRGLGRVRTGDLRHAIPTRYQLRYKPMVRDPRIELGVSCSQSRRVSHLPRPGNPRPDGMKYWPVWVCVLSTVEFTRVDTAGMAGVGKPLEQTKTPPGGILPGGGVSRV